MRCGNVFDINKPKKKKSKGAIALLVILVALLLAATAFFVSVIMKSTASQRIDHDEIAVTVGDDEITVGEYLYWFAYVDAYYYNYYSYYYLLSIIIITRLKIFVK